MTSAQEKAIQKMIFDKMPEQLNLEYALWTRKAVQQFVEREFGVVLAINTMGDYLCKWGFSPQRLNQRAYERCSKHAQTWLDEEYPKTKKEAKRQHAQIQWGDETGVTNPCSHGRSDAPKGKTPVKKRISRQIKVDLLHSMVG